MKRSFPVIDADGHVLERDRELREFLRVDFRSVLRKRERVPDGTASRIAIMCDYKTWLSISPLLSWRPW